jgi:chemotaxis response regulator CheB
LRFVLCDDDEMLCSMVDAVISTHGHELVGIADNTTSGVGLVEHGRPDVVVVDPTVGCNTDFDVIDTAIAKGARVVVVSRSAEAPSSGRYQPEPLFVAKPDLPALEKIIERLDVDAGAAEGDRRRRPVRAASGPPPTGITDAAAFYAALNDAAAADALVSIGRPASDNSGVDPSVVAEIVAESVRSTDRLLLATSSVLVLLPGGGADAVESLFARTHDGVAPTTHLEFRSVVVREGESPADAFDRLKRAPESVRS